MTATQEQILARHEDDPAEVQRRLEEASRARRIAGAKKRNEQAASRAKASPEGRMRRDRFMNCAARAVLFILSLLAIRPAFAGEWTEDKAESKRMTECVRACMTKPKPEQVACMKRCLPKDARPM